MNLTKRILVVHHETQTGQKWKQALAEIGIETIMVSTEQEARVVFAESPVDLALIAEGTESEASFEFAGDLKRQKADMPIVMVLQAVRLPLVVQGLRYGLTDVMPTEEDLGPLVKRVKVLLERATSGDPSEAELAAAEATLQQLDPEYGQGNQEELDSDAAELWSQQMEELKIERKRLETIGQEVDRKTKLLAKEREAMQRETRRESNGSKRSVSSRCGRRTCGSTNRRFAASRTKLKRD